MIRNVIEYLELSAVRFPDKTAVTDIEKAYTFSQLLELSNIIGTGIAKKADIGRPVAVLMEKSADTLGIFMGIIKAGCFYSLLNPDLPINRLSQIYSVLCPQLIITDSRHLELAEKLTEKENIITVQQLKETFIDNGLLLERKNKSIDTNPLYANFTSGSTGVPKGVLVSHKSVIDFIDTFTETFKIDDTDIIGNQAPFDFDVSVKDIYSALKTGASLVIIPKQLFSQPAKLLDYICSSGITTMIWAVSALCLISTFHGLDYKTPETVKRILFSGEVMPLKHLNIWMDKLKSTEFVNLYGPTEITCNCTYHIVKRDKDYSNGIPIGKPFPNEDVFLLNNDNKKIDAIDEVGEICVRGTALALGYFGNEEQTAKAFVQNPLNSQYPEKIYRTGDLGKYNGDGELIFCGRKDFQVKYMGHRIELEEIERAISKIQGIERCCVIFEEKKQKLYGFYLGNKDKKDLLSELKKSLPVFMVPTRLKQLDAFPITKNGKIDRKKLMEET